MYVMCYFFPTSKLETVSDIFQTKNPNKSMLPEHAKFRSQTKLPFIKPTKSLSGSRGCLSQSEPLLGEGGVHHSTTGPHRDTQTHTSKFNN